MIKQTILFSILFGLITLSVIHIKAETENILAVKTETPVEIFNRCEQDIYTMNPDNVDRVKNILKIVVETVNIGIVQFQKSINTLKHAKKEAAQKENLLHKINHLLTLRYPLLIEGLSWHEVNYPCNDEACYKMKVFLLSQKSQNLFDSLSKYDQAIVLNIYDYIVTKVKQSNTLLQYLSLHGFFRITHNY